MAAPTPKGQGGGPGRRNFNKPAKETSFGSAGSTQRGSRTVKPPMTQAERNAATKQDKAKVTKAQESRADANAKKKLQSKKQMFRDLVGKGMSHAKAHEEVVAKHGNIDIAVLKNALKGGK